MRLYKVKPQEKSFSWGKMQVVELGERGRGRELVLVPFHAPAPDGSNQYQIGTTKTGRSKIIYDSPSAGWIARINTGSTYTRDTIGCCYIHPEDKKNIIVVAIGMGAFGAAGRIGNWYDYLLQIKTMPTRIFVRPSGGAKRPCYWLVFQADQVDRVELEETDLYGSSLLPYMSNGDSDDRLAAGLIPL